MLYFLPKVYDIVLLCQLFKPQKQREQRKQSRMSWMNYCDHRNLLLLCSANPFCFPKINARKKHGDKTRQQRKDNIRMSWIHAPSIRVKLNAQARRNARVHFGRPVTQKNGWWIGSGKYPHKCTKNSSFGIIGILFNEFSRILWIDCSLLKVDSCFNEMFSFVRLVFSFV